MIFAQSLARFGLVGSTLIGVSFVVSSVVTTALLDRTSRYGTR